MAKNNFYYAAKRSEYRNNFLPFDYYDFWLTAKENENLRCQNKIRDYVHTPFDWDEDQDYYLESEEKFNHNNQATQTSERPRHENLRKSRQRQETDKENNEVRFNDDHHHHHKQHNNHNHNHSQVQNQTNQNQDIKKNHNERKHKKKQESEQSEETESDTLSDEREKKKSNKKSTKNAGIQIYAPETLSFNISKPRKVQSANIKRSKSIVNSKQNDNKSITNMSVQTPPAWNLRDYRSNKPNKSIHRSASASIAELKPKRAPFANYGWATRTKDLSNKPTHNALANKNLAAHNNKDAIIELTLQKIKKNANMMANEYSAIESQSAERFHTGRSDSRAWNSEYGEKYPDYSRSPSRNEIYMNKNPYKINKSSLIANFQPLRRGPRSQPKKVYYVE